MGFFKLVRPNGKRFGPRLWVEVVCEVADETTSLRSEEKVRFLARHILDLGINKDQKLIENLLVLHECNVDKVIADVRALEAAAQTSRGTNLTYWITPKALSGSESEEEMTKRHAGHLPRRSALPTPQAQAQAPTATFTTTTGSSSSIQAESRRVSDEVRQINDEVRKVNDEVRKFRGKEFGKPSSREKDGETVSTYSPSTTSAADSSASASTSASAWTVSTTDTSHSAVRRTCAVRKVYGSAKDDEQQMINDKKKLDMDRLTLASSPTTSSWEIIP